MKSAVARVLNDKINESGKSRLVKEGFLARLKLGAELFGGIIELCKCRAGVNMYEVLACSVVFNSLSPHGLCPTRLLCSWNSPGKNTGVRCHFLLQGIFPAQGLKITLGTVYNTYNTQSMCKLTLF